MTKRQISLGAVVLLAMVTAASAQRAAAGVGTATPDAVAYHGAWQLYRRLAVFFGTRALLAEHAYWRAVAQ